MSTISHFDVLGELGRGGMGVILRVRHGPTGAIRALKLLDGVPDRESLERFRREGEALARLGGEGVVPVHETGVDGRRLYLVMDLMPGGSLRDRLQSAGRLPWSEAALLGAKLARTLARAHAQGLVHRDLKPENVLHDDRGEPRLADWGCVRDLARSALTRTGETLGTPPYMAPEQLRGQAVGPPADVWALGLLVHEAVSGERPFAGTMRQIHEAAVARRRPSLVKAGAPRALEALVARALDPGPARRPSADALARELEAVARGRGQEPARTGLRLALGGGLAVAGLAAVLALVGSGHGSAASPAPAPSSGSPRTPGPSASRVPRATPTPSPAVSSRDRDVATITSFLAVAEDAATARAGPEAAVRLALVRETSEAQDAAKRLASDPLPALTEEAWGEAVWRLVREPDAGLATPRHDRAELLGLVLGATRPRTLLLRAALAALADGAGATLSPLPAPEEVAALRERHPVEAAWVRVIAPPLAPSEAEMKAVVEEDERERRALEGPEYEGDPVARFVRALFVGRAAAQEIGLLVAGTRAEAPARLDRVRRLAASGRAIDVPGGRNWQLDVVTLTLDGALLGGLAGPLAPAARDEALGEVAAMASQNWGHGFGVVFELLLDYWHARDLPEPARTVGLVSVRQRALEHATGAAGVTDVWCRGIVCGASLSLGDGGTARALLLDDGGRLAHGLLATGWLLHEADDALEVGGPSRR